MLTLTPLTYLLLLPILGSLNCTQHSTRFLHLPPVLLLLFPLPLPLEHPSSMADQELHHLQLMHCLLEQQVYCLLPVSCLRPKKQDRLRNCRSQEEPRETGLINAMWYAGWDSGTEGGN